MAVALSRSGVVPRTPLFEPLLSLRTVFLGRVRNHFGHSLSDAITLAGLPFSAQYRRGTTDRYTRTSMTLVPKLVPISANTNVVTICGTDIFICR